MGDTKGSTGRLNNSQSGFSLTSKDGISNFGVLSQEASAHDVALGRDWALSCLVVRIRQCSRHSRKESDLVASWEAVRWTPRLERRQMMWKGEQRQWRLQQQRAVARTVKTVRGAAYSCFNGHERGAAVVGKCGLSKVLEVSGERNSNIMQCEVLRLSVRGEVSFDQHREGFAAFPICRCPHGCLGSCPARHCLNFSRLITQIAAGHLQSLVVVSVSASLLPCSEVFEATSTATCSGRFPKTCLLRRKRPEKDVREVQVMSL